MAPKVYQGPTRPGTSEWLFRNTGISGNLIPATRQEIQSGRLPIQNVDQGTTRFPDLAPGYIPPSGGGGVGTPTNNQSSGPSQQEIDRINQENWNNAINEQYQPQINYLNEMENRTNQAQAEALASSQSQYGGLLGLLPGEQKQYQQGIDVAQQQLGENTRSAYDQAVRAYNALKQQQGARFGAGSSAGGAVGELAAQQYFRSQGGIGQQNVQAQGQIGQEKLRLDNYIAQKRTSLETSRQQADEKIKSDFRTQLAQIAQNRVLTEQQKTNAKLELLKQTIADSKAIAAADQSLRQQIAIFAAQQYATVSGQQFTPQGLNTAIQPFLNSQMRFGSRPAQTNAFAGVAGGLSDQFDEFGNPIT